MRHIMLTQIYQICSWTFADGEVASVDQSRQTQAEETNEAIHTQDKPFVQNETSRRQESKNRTGDSWILHIYFQRLLWTWFHNKSPVGSKKMRTITAWEKKLFIFLEILADRSFFSSEPAVNVLFLVKWCCLRRSVAWILFQSRQADAKIVRGAATAFWSCQLFGDHTT
jgi:hypothetical protein